MGLLGVIIAAFLCSETLGLVAILAVVGGYAALTQPPRAPSLSARFRSDATALLAMCEEQQVPRLQPPGPLSDHTDHASIFRRILDGAERFGRDLRP